MEEVNPTTSEPTESSMPSWYVMEQIPGMGDKPEFLLDKFTNLGEQAKAFVELEKRMGGFKGAPKDGYLVDHLGERLGADVPADAPLVESLMNTAQKLNMSQEAFEEFLGTIVQVQKSFDIDPQAELAKLGPDGEQQIGLLKSWAENNFTPEEVDVLDEMLGTAEQVKVLSKLRAMTSKSALPTAAEAAAHIRPTSVKDLEIEMAQNLTKYETDARYRADWNARLAKITG